MLSRFRSTLSGYATYSARGGLLPFLLHRITGLGTLLFLTIHITTTASVYFSPSFYNRFITVFRSPVFMLGEIVLVHARLAGLRFLPAVVRLCAWDQRPAAGAVRLHPERKIPQGGGVGTVGGLAGHIGDRSIGDHRRGAAASIGVV